MTFRSAQSARVLIGLLSASAYTRSLGADSQTDMVDVTTIVDTAKALIPGQDGSTFQIAGPVDVDGTTNGQYDALQSQKAAAVDVPITFGMDGLAIGSNVWLLNALETHLEFSSALTGSADWAMNAVTDGMTDFNGATLSDLIAITTTTNGTNVDGSASTANGGVAHLHVTAFSGLTSNDVTIEHSANGSTGWATLVTFTQATGLTAERVVVAAGTTVNRYLRVVDTVVGTGSCTRLASFARR